MAKRRVETPPGHLPGQGALSQRVGIGNPARVYSISGISSGRQQGLGLVPDPGRGYLPGDISPGQTASGLQQAAGNGKFPVRAGCKISEKKTPKPTQPHPFDLVELTVPILLGEEAVWWSICLPCSAAKAKLKVFYLRLK